MVVLSTDLEYDRTHARTPPTWDAPTGPFRFVNKELLSIITYTDLDDEILEPELIITSTIFKQSMDSLIECYLCGEILEYHFLLKFILSKLKYK